MRCILTLIFNISAISLLLISGPTASKAEIVDRTLAQVGDNIITLYDIDIFAPSVVRSINSLPAEERTTEWADYFEKTLNYMIDSTVLQIAAARAGATTAPGEVDDAIIRLRDENNEFRTFVRNVLNREGRITPELYLFVQNELLKSKIVPTLQARAVVTEEDIYNYIKQDPDADLGAMEYNIDLLFLPDEAANKAFYEELDHGSFETAAAVVEQSVVPMGWVTKTHLVKDIANALDALQTGDVSAPYQEEDVRYMVVRLADTRIKTQLSEDMRNNVIARIKSERMTGIFEKWLENSRQSIVIHKF